MTHIIICWSQQRIHEMRRVFIVCDSLIRKEDIINVNNNELKLIHVFECHVWGGRSNDLNYIASVPSKSIEEVGSYNVVKNTDDALVCELVDGVVKLIHPHIFWSPCVVHTQKHAFKNTCALKNIEANEVTYGNIVRLLTLRVLHEPFHQLPIFNHHVKLRCLSLLKLGMFSCFYVVDVQRNKMWSGWFGD